MSHRLHTQADRLPSDDCVADTFDPADVTVLTAIRTWLRPDCESVRNRSDWRTTLMHAGLRADGIEHFDLLMHALTHVAQRPLDMRCRCASELGKDEASVLRTIALLQKTQSADALRELTDWLPGPSVSGVLKLIRWFAIDLLDAGMEIDIQSRRVSYMH